MSYDKTEQDRVIEVFTQLLWKATGDGGKKREAGLKPPWYRDETHERALFSHLYKWKRGDRVDEDSGAHPLVHLAWRALAIAYQQSFGCVDPAHPSSPFWTRGVEDDAQDEGKVDDRSVRGLARASGWGDGRADVEWGRVYGEPDPEPTDSEPPVCYGGPTCHHDGYDDGYAR